MTTGPFYPPGAGGGTPGAVSSQSLVYRKGAASGGNVFGDWPSLYAVASAMPGVKNVVIDGSIAPCDVPAGAYSLDGFCFTSIQTNGSPASVLTFANGATATINESMVVGYGVTLAAAAAGAGAHITIGTGAAIQLFGGATLLGSAARPLASIGAGAYAIVLCNGSAGIGDTAHAAFTIAGACYFVLLANSTLNANACTGAGSSNALADSSSVANSIIGGGTVTKLDDAARMNYTPTTVANWSGVAPTSVANALDRIAAKITPIP